jgi:aldehyde oxidoreductase
MKKIVLEVNGLTKQYEVSPDRLLIDLLRDDLHITVAKQSCGRTKRLSVQPESG